MGNTVAPSASAVQPPEASWDTTQARMTLSARLKRFGTGFSGVGRAVANGSTRFIWR
jgi:hypothetical protein